MYFYIRPLYYLPSLNDSVHDSVSYTQTPRPVPPTLSELGLLSEQGIQWNPLNKDTSHMTPLFFLCVFSVDMPEGGGYDPRDTEALVLQLDDTRSKLE